MKPYKILEKQKNVIEKMRFNMQFSKNKDRDANILNTAVDTANCLESVLNKELKLSIVDSLIHSLMYEYMLKNKVYNGGSLSLNEMVSKIELGMNKGYSKEQVVSILKTHEMTNVLKYKDIDSHKFTDFNKLIDNLVTSIKTGI